MFEQKKIGVALSGGGAKGLAHIGVLKVFEDNNIPIHMIAGTSMGAIIGAFYSAEPNAKKIKKEILENDLNSLLDYTFPRKGFIKGYKIEEFLEKKLGNLSFKDLKIPLYITAFDIKKKQEVIFSRGSVVRALRASIAIPGLFIPTENNHQILVDGAVTDPVPTEILEKKGADIIIAVNVNHMKEKKPLIDQEASFKKDYKEIPGIFQNVSASFQVMGYESAKADLEGDKADLIININLEKKATMDFSKAKSIISAGERAAKKSLNQIMKITNNPLTNFINELDPKNLIQPFK